MFAETVPSWPCDVVKPKFTASLVSIKLLLCFFRLVATPECWLNLSMSLYGGPINRGNKIKFLITESMGEGLISYSPQEPKP